MAGATGNQNMCQQCTEGNENLGAPADAAEEHVEIKDIGEPVEICMQQSPQCGPPGKALFISNPDAHPTSRPDCFTLGTKGYGRPYQHPLYTTSNATYGHIDAPPELNAKKFPKNNRFTSRQSLGGPYKDVHFTTEMEVNVD